MTGAFKRWLGGEPSAVLPSPSEHAIEPEADANVDQFLDAPASNRIGICCSGGGIRSASYNLGALQAMREEGVLEKATYLSAVSGGSYIAAAHTIVASKSSPESLADEAPYAPGSPEELHLRNRSNYLYPNLAGVVALVFNLLYGMAVNASVIGATLVLVAFPLGWIYSAWIYPEMLGEPNLSPAILKIGTTPGGVVVALLVEAIGLIAFERIMDALHPVPDEAHRFFRTWSYRLTLLSLVTFVFWIALPWGVAAGSAAWLEIRRLIWILRSWTTSFGFAEPRDQFTYLVIAISACFVLFGAFRVVVRGAARVSLLLAQVFGWLLILMPFLILVRHSSFTGFNGEGMLTLLPAAGLLLFLGLVGTNLRWSMQPFYRRRLSSAFFVRRVSGIQAEELPWGSPVSLSSLDPDGLHKLPELIVSAALNVSDPGVTPPRRNADGFTFTRNRSGSPASRYVATASLEQEAGSRVLTLPGMVTVAGAALSPSMGKMTLRQATMVLAMVNARLGMWLPNPLYKADWGAGSRWKKLIRSWRTPGPLYLWYELLGKNSLKKRYVYVSDGGHYENLGLVELLRRGCTEIFCFDAAGDDIDTFHTLGGAVQIAKSDLQVEIDIQPEEALKPDPDSKRSNDVCKEGTLMYPNDVEGHLYFAKAAITNGCPWNVLAYREKDPKFPTHSTANQIFTDEMFEAYRSLGYYSAKRAVELRAQAKTGGAGSGGGSA